MSVSVLFVNIRLAGRRRDVGNDDDGDGSADRPLSLCMVERCNIVNDVVICVTVVLWRVIC